MAAQNKLSGKAYEGTFKGGQEPKHGLSEKSEGETKGVFGGEGGGKHLSKVSGYEPARPSGGDGMFSLQGKSYKGPENWQPEDKGDVSNQP